MAGSLTDWPRPHFGGGGGDPFLFYVVFGKIRNEPLSRSQYRCAGIPDGLEVMAYGPDSHPEIVSSFRQDLAYLWDRLRHDDPTFAQQITAQEHCLLLRGSFSDPPMLNYLRDTVGLVTHALDNGGVAVYDPQMLRWWSPSHWRERIFDPAGPVPRHHVVILVSREEDGSEWIHTRGMRKFGRPDLSIHNTPSELKDAAIDLCNRFIEFQAFGGVIDEGQEIRLKSLPSGMRCHHRGDLEDPDFNNVHVEIEWR